MGRDTSSSHLIVHLAKMPKQITDIKTFLEIAGRKDASAARVKRTVVRKSSRSSSSSKKASSSGVATQTKFKIRCSKYVYTLVVEDAEKAEKLKNSLPPTLNVTEISSKVAKR